MFAYCSFLIPIKKISQNRFAVAMKHPVASYQDHVLIIPRKLARNIFCLSANDFMAIIEMAEKIRQDDTRDFALLINGGSRQDVMQAHFHLFTGNLAEEKGLNAGKASHSQDVYFGEQIASNLHELLTEHEVTEESFSMLIQFEHGTNPSVYFT